MTLPAFAAERGCRSYRSTSAAGAGAQQQTNRTLLLLLLLSTDGIDRETDGHPTVTQCSAYYPARHTPHTPHTPAASLRNKEQWKTKDPKVTNMPHSNESVLTQKEPVKYTNKKDNRYKTTKTTKLQKATKNTCS